MSKKLLGIIISVVVILGAGTATFVATRSDDPAANQAGESQNNGDQPTFNAVATDSQAFIAKMKTTTNEGDTVNATIRSDGKGTAHYTSTVEGNELSMYLTNEGFISCQGGNCFKLPQSQQAEDINQDIFEYSESDINEFKNTAKYLGKESCPAGTCEVWEADDQDENYTTKVFLANDGRPSKLTSTGPEGTVEVTYEYKPVTINVPTNVQTLPGAQ